MQKVQLQGANTGRRNIYDCAHHHYYDWMQIEIHKHILKLYQIMPDNVHHCQDTERSTGVRLVP